MRTPGLRVAVCLSSLILVLTVGCVSKDQYEKLDAAYRKCNEHREQLQQELAAEKDNVAALNNQLAALRDGQSGKDGRLAALEKENAALSAEMEKLRAAAEDALNRPIEPPKVIVRKLPPALHKALQDLAKKYPDMVEYDAKRGAVKWKSDLLFALGSDVVRDSAKPSLQAFAKIARSTAAASFDVIVVGHTDNLRIVREATRKLHPTNWHLSAHRSIAVNNLLMGQGVPTTRTGVMGYGEYRPIASNSNDAGRQKNRRVEIYLVNRKILGVGNADGIFHVKGTNLAFARVK